MECIATILTSICGRLTEGLGSSLQTQGERGLSCLGDLVRAALRDRIREWRMKVVLVPTQTTTVVGAEETVGAIRRHLRGDQVDVVGIVGMGGVGKTTILKEINNDFYMNGAGKFDIVVFATISREGNALRVQKQIGGRLDLSELTDEVDANRDRLHGSLSNKRYLLLLDDIWGELDLGEIGIPLPNKFNGCKIVLTTRSEDVFGNFLRRWCQRRQRAQMVELSPLDETPSWELFCGMVDARVDLERPDIKPPAQKLVQKCGGLPLALVTVGAAMAVETDPVLWRKAVAQMEESPYHLQGMDDVYSSLMFSIDRLDKGKLLPCFLYCSLFPDYNIPEQQLIEYWIGEGLLDGGDELSPWGKRVDSTIHGARREGSDVIQKLKKLHLLETGSSEDQSRCVKMHDLLRQVALMLGRKEPNRFLVHATDCPPEDESPRGAIEVDGWEEATKVSLMNSLIEEGFIPEMPNCPKVSTLLMHNTTLPRELHDGFFTSMHNLTVLDLSRANYVTEYGNVYLRSFPTSICMLTELRYLNLNWTAIRSLPKELRNLVKLRQLDLSETYHLTEIPRQAISGLSNLQVLNMKLSAYKWGEEASNLSNLEGVGGDEDRLLCLNDLHELKQLQDVNIDLQSLYLFSDKSVNRGHSLLRCITVLSPVRINDLTTDSLQLALQSMPILRELQIRSCGSLSGELVLDGRVHTPVLCQLELLALRHVPISAIVIIIGDNEEHGYVGEGTSRRREGGAAGLPLQYLKCLYVSHCSALKDISWVAQLRLVELIVVFSCYRMEGLLSPADENCTARAIPATKHGDRVDEILPQLKSLKLVNLPKLRGICDCRQSLTSLEYLWVIDCPLLETLPLGSQSKIKRIEGRKEWWEELEWGDQTKWVFSHKFRESRWAAVRRRVSRD